MKEKRAAWKGWISKNQDIRSTRARSRSTPKDGILAFDKHKSLQQAVAAADL